LASSPHPHKSLQWTCTRKEQGKTVTRRLPTEDAAISQHWIANRRQLEAVLEEKRDLSRQAGEQILASHGRPYHGPKRPRHPPRSAS
jgi:hypothetical protein